MAVPQSRPTPSASERDEVDEHALVDAAQRDARDFGALYEANFERVYAYVVRRVRDRHEAEDLTADVFQQALANLARYEWRGVPFRAWLYRIAANAIADRGKRAALEQRSAAERPAEEPAGDEIEARALLFRLVSRLPEDQARVVRLRFAEQRSVRQIAELLGRSEGAIKQLQFRGLQTLRALLGEHHG